LAAALQPVSYLLFDPYDTRSGRIKDRMGGVLARLAVF